MVKMGTARVPCTQTTVGERTQRAREKMQRRPQPLSLSDELSEVSNAQMFQVRTTAGGQAWAVNSVITLALYTLSLVYTRSPRLKSES